jgi:hypothetical protein
MNPSDTTAALVPLAATAAAMLALAACSSPPRARVIDRLDPVTGTTVTVLGKPAELVTADNRGPQRDPFAFAAPFDIDRMGNRELYLWVSVPQDNGPVSNVSVLCDGRPLDLSEARLDPQQLQLSRPPYPRVAPWSGDWYFRLSDAGLKCLAGAHGMAVESHVKGETGESDDRFAAEGGELGKFAAFAAHLGGQ